MRLVKTASGKKTIKISKKEWHSIGKKAGWEDTMKDLGRYNAAFPIKEKNAEILPMPLYDDINEINGEIMSWVEKYMDNYPEEQWIEKQSLIYKKISEFCLSQAELYSI